MKDPRVIVESDDAEMDEFLMELVDGVVTQHGVRRQTPPQLNWPALSAKLDRASKLMAQGERLYLDTITIIEGCSEHPQFEPMMVLAQEIQADIKKCRMSVTYDIATFRLIDAMPKADAFDWDLEDET